MSTRLEALTARRRALQDRCARQRGEIGETQASIDAGAARVDHALAVARQLTPLLVVGGIVIVVAVGPGRVWALLRQGLAILPVATRAFRLLR